MVSILVGVRQVTNSSDVLDVLREIKELKSWLYGAEGKEGDIPEIKAHLNELNREIPKLKERQAIHHATLYGHDNDSGLVKQVEQTKTRLWKLAIVIALISSSVGGGIAGIIQLLT